MPTVQPGPRTGKTPTTKGLRAVMTHTLAVVVTIPIHTVSESNARDHWRVRASRAKRQRAIVTLMLRGLEIPPLPVTVALTRIAPLELDDDNLRGALKACRDAVADVLGLPSDRDPRVTWAYAQRKGKAREYAVEVRIEVRQ